MEKDDECMQHDATPLPSTTGNKERPAEHLLSDPAHTVQEQAKPIHSAKKKWDDLQWLQFGVRPD